MSDAWRVVLADGSVAQVTVTDDGEGTYDAAAWDGLISAEGGAEVAIMRLAVMAGVPARDHPAGGAYAGRSHAGARCIPARVSWHRQPRDAQIGTTRHDSLLPHGAWVATRGFDVPLECDAESPVTPSWCENRHGVWREIARQGG